MKILLRASVGAMLYLTFAWPFVHSDEAAYKALAIGAFAVFILTLAAIIAMKACKARRTSS